MDSSSIIEGTVKFRDGKKWKSRWCVMRKLSPVADCLHLQLYRDSKDRYKQGHTKASLSLQQFLGLETGFTLDKESNTVAILCQDVVVILAFDSRERLMQWQVKLSNHLGDGPRFLVLLQSAPIKARLQQGPARMHVQEKGFCLTQGVPPRLIGQWLISNLRRYGAVEGGRFCFEGGSRCGRGEGLHVLLTDQGDDIAAALRLAAQGQLHAARANRRPLSRNMSVMDSPRRPPLRAELRHPEILDPGLIPSRVDSPYTDLDSNYGCGPITEGSVTLDGVMGALPMERCMSCISKLGAMSRSSTATTAIAAPCGGPGSVYWEHSQCDRHSLSSGSDSGGSGWSQSTSKAPARPPKPSPQHCKKPCFPPPQSNSAYDNYDIPRMILPYVDRDTAKTPTAGDQLSAQDYYDTPRKIKECLVTMETVRKPCGCILRIRQQPIEVPGGVERNCVCQRLIGSCLGMQPPTSREDELSSLYATVDMSKKCHRNTNTQPRAEEGNNYANLEPDGNRGEMVVSVTQPTSTTCANYANMEFAQSLELYENARSVMDMAASIQAEMMVVQTCSKCGHAQQSNNSGGDAGGAGEQNYLFMGPNSMHVKEQEPPRIQPPQNGLHRNGHHSSSGYLPMSPAVKQRLGAKPISSSNPNLLCCNKEPSTTQGSPVASPCHINSSVRYQRNQLLESAENLEVSSVDEDSSRRRSGSVDSSVSGSRTDPSVIAGPEDVLSSSPSSSCTCGHQQTQIQQLVRRSSSVPCKSSAALTANGSGSSNSNRDSSSSNDSGVFELSRRVTVPSCHNPASGIHASTLPRRSKSSDPLRDLSFNFSSTNPSKCPPATGEGKSASAEAEVPIINVAALATGSTSSGTSDMSDYFETLSLSSHSSSDMPQACPPPSCTLRPRSGNEYLSLQRLTAIAPVPEERH